MKRFRFVLESVATLRELRLLRARQRYAAALQESVRRSGELARADAALEVLVAGRLAARASGVHPEWETAAAHAHRAAVATRAQAATALARVNAEVEEARQEWIDAHRGRRLVENLRERARVRHGQEQQRQEQAALDEIGTLRAATR